MFIHAPLSIVLADVVKALPAFQPDRSRLVLPGAIAGVNSAIASGRNLGKSDRVYLADCLFAGSFG
jgi:hypothetical protein